MIQANVAAAETLEEKRLPLVYRVHDAPSPEKLKGLRDFLETLDMKVPHAGQHSSINLPSRAPSKNGALASSGTGTGFAGASVVVGVMRLPRAY